MIHLQQNFYDPGSSWPHLSLNKTLNSETRGALNAAASITIINYDQVTICVDTAVL